jgi:hypothetical protein
VEDDFDALHASILLKAYDAVNGAAESRGGAPH